MEFVPAWFARGPHAQTVWGRLFRRRRLVTFRRETLETPDQDELVLDHMDISGPRPQASGPHFVLLHGLEGSSNSVYIQGMLRTIARHGCSATAMNFRSCARDPKNVLRSIPNRRPRYYHSGETSDFDLTVRTLHARGLPLVAFGGSLGGNALLKWLGENPGQTFVRAAATLSVPYDLAAGADHLDKTRIGRFYVNGFLNGLKRKMRDVARAHPQAQLDLPRALAARSFREFDDAATAPLHGFRDANEYYERASAIRYLARITTPTLCISAADDPFLPREALDEARRVASPAVEFRITEKGGHTGFVTGSAPWNCLYWAEELAVRWLIEHGSKIAS